ncbi:ANTAR domain-containing response regulator [Salinisphaera sp. Q1T1-3]|uniref:ANTAR domain-containing response regulator n=1 Tax=Salinisphaera sp. Q1T1-3 TaxID=2321229 RepID=UPI000E72CA16|nr:ANTAR domain-containing protein [Salinisphaera sp. Q1T1-3]RJS93154.1 ANTAR domain-containing protein [Salinisphaera sp. Q1T1-3]
MRVLLVDRQSARLSTLRAVIEDAGFSVIDTVSDQADLYEAVDRLAPDAIIVGADSPSRDVLDDVASLSASYPRPLLMLSSRDDRRLMAQASEAGIAAYVMDGLSPALVRSLVDVAVRQSEQMASLRAELADARERLVDRQAIHRAKCLLMEDQGLSEDAAYRQLRQTAMDRALPMVEIARQLLSRAAE